jgi:toxin ParE1/3/4
MADVRRIVWAPRSRRDLLEIWRYFARVGSVEVADDVLREIHRAVARLARNAFMGRPRDELAPGLRSVLVHPHVVFYRVTDQSVAIARVLHQRRDLAAIFSRERDQ